MKTSLIWKRSIIENKKIITTEEIHKLARALNKQEERSLRYLQEHNYILRIFRGIFYIKSPEERERGFLKLSVYEIVTMGLKLKNVDNWYFGLETALKMNEMTHEYFMLNFVITDSFRTTKIIDIMGTKFLFLKWSKRHFETGIISKDGIRYSDPEKTVLDLEYKKYLRSKRIDEKTSTIKEYKNVLNQKKVIKYLELYPPGFTKWIREHL